MLSQPDLEVPHLPGLLFLCLALVTQCPDCSASLPNPAEASQTYTPLTPLCRLSLPLSDIVAPFVLLLLCPNSDTCYLKYPSKMPMSQGFYFYQPLPLLFDMLLRPCQNGNHCTRSHL